VFALPEAFDDSLQAPVLCAVQQTAQYSPEDFPQESPPGAKVIAQKLFFRAYLVRRKK